MIPSRTPRFGWGASDGSLAAFLFPGPLLFSQLPGMGFVAGGLTVPQSDAKVSGLLQRLSPLCAAVPRHPYEVMIELDPLSILVTIVYVIILYLFLARVFFGPVLKTLDQRRAAIEGSLQAAERRIQEVEAKTSEYEGALREARSEAYRNQEAIREGALAERARLLAEARKEADAIIEDAKARLASETAIARKELDAEIDRLAARLTETLLQDG